MKRTALKRKTALKAHKRLSPISPKQAAKNKAWKEVTDEKAEELDYICQWCHQPGQRDNPNRIFPPMAYLTGHHIKKRRYNDHTKENCYVCHWLCHDFIELWNIDVTEYPDEEVWKNRAV
jgi:hypothetical protein